MAGSVTALRRALSLGCGVNINRVKIKPISDGADLYARLPLAVVSSKLWLSNERRATKETFAWYGVRRSTNSSSKSSKSSKRRMLLTLGQVEEQTMEEER